MLTLELDIAATQLNAEVNFLDSKRISLLPLVDWSRGLGQWKRNSRIDCISRRKY